MFAGTMVSVEDQQPGDREDVAFSQSFTWDGWKNDGPLVVFVLVGAGSIAASFSVHGWARLGLQILGALLMLPLIVLVVLTTLGGALAALLNGKPSVFERLALVALAVGLGVWLGSYTPGAPQELLIMPAGLLGSGYMLRGGRVRQPGTRRRFAVCVALIALAAGVTGLWLLAKV
jgi:hypothetical protein